MRQHYLDPSERDLMLTIAQDPEGYLETESSSRLIGYLGGYNYARDELFASRPCVRVQESFHRYLCRAALKLDYDDSGAIPSFPPLDIRDLLSSEGFTLQDVLSPENLKRILSSKKIGEAVSSRRPPNFGFYSISSILSLVCENEVAAFRYYVSVWKSWLNSATIDERMTYVENVNEIPPRARGVIPMLKGMKGYPPCDTLPALRCFVDGYLYAYNELGKSPERPFPFSQFTVWLIQKKMPFPIQVEYRWDRLILFNSLNVFHAVDMFFVYMEAFCSEIGLDFRDP